MGMIVQNILRKNGKIKLGNISQAKFLKYQKATPAWDVTKYLSPKSRLHPSDRKKHF